MKSIFRLEPALAWAQAHREQLCQKGRGLVTQASIASGAEVISSLEMRLHKLQFIELLRKGDRPAAISYARAHFPHFVGSGGVHEKEVQTLMGAIMYAGNPEKLLRSPYGYLLDGGLWHEIRELFTKDACSLMGLSVDSPLNVVVNAGCKALPALLNIKQVLFFFSPRCYF